MFSFFKKYINPIPLSTTYDTSSIESKSILQRFTSKNLKLELSKNILPFQFGLVSNDTTQLHSVFALKNFMLQTSIDKQNIQFLMQNQYKNITTKFQSIKNVNDIYTQLEIQLINKYNNITYKNVINYNVPVNVVNIMQSVNKNLSLGIELMTFGNNINYGLMARMMNDKSVVTMNVQGNGVYVNMYRKINKFFSIASETVMNQSVVNQCVGMKLETRKADVKLEIDSEAMMRINVANKLVEGCVFSVSSEMNVVNGKQSFGIGLSLEQ